MFLIWFSLPPCSGFLGFFPPRNCCSSRAVLRLRKRWFCLTADESPVGVAVRGWLVLIFLHFLPELRGRDLHSRYLALLVFWTVLLFELGGFPPRARR